MTSRNRVTIDYDYTYYMVTITKHQKLDHVTVNQLIAVIHQIRWKFTDSKLINYVFESSGKYNQLHAHLLLASPVPIQFTKLCSANGFRIFWKKVNVRTIDRVISYMRKDLIGEFSQEQIIDTNRFKLYAF